MKNDSLWLSTQKHDLGFWNLDTFFIIVCGYHTKSYNSQLLSNLSYRTRSTSTIDRQQIKIHLSIPIQNQEHSIRWILSSVIRQQKIIRIQILLISGQNLVKLLSKPLHGNLYQITSTRQLFKKINSQKQGKILSGRDENGCTRSNSKENGVVLVQNLS